MARPEEILPKLADLLQSNSLIPFIGAGMSAPCYPLWGKLVKDLITKIPTEDARREATAAACRQDFLYAAAVIEHDLRNEPLLEALAEAFRHEAAQNPQIAEARYSLLKAGRGRCGPTSD